MTNLEQQKSNDLELVDEKKFTLPNTVEEINKIENNEYPDDSELQKAENIIKNGGDTGEITKLNRELACDLISNPELIRNDSLDLRGLKNLNQEVAEELVKVEADYLVLTGLDNIDEAVINELSKFNGKLVFNIYEYVKILPGNEILKGKMMHDREYVQDIVSKIVKNDVQKRKEQHETNFDKNE